MEGGGGMQPRRISLDAADAATPVHSPAVRAGAGAGAEACAEQEVGSDGFKLGSLQVLYCLLAPQDCLLASPQD